MPTCPKCNLPLRTETVLFEQALPEGAAERARSTVRGADLLFVIGSTLSRSCAFIGLVGAAPCCSGHHSPPRTWACELRIVRPANELPAEALRLGIPVVMVNLDDTSYDANVSLIRQPAGKFFAEAPAHGYWRLLGLHLYAQAALPVFQVMQLLGDGDWHQEEVEATYTRFSAPLMSLLLRFRTVNRRPGTQQIVMPIRQEHDASGGTSPQPQIPEVTRLCCIWDLVLEVPSST